MASRTLHFFMTMEELWSMLEAIATKHELSMYIYPRLAGNGMPRRWEPASLPPTDFKPPVLIYIDAQRERQFDLEYLDRAPVGEIGVVTLDIEGVEGNRLYLNDLGAKSDWLGDDDQIHENPESLRLHRKLKTDVLKYVRNGMLLKNIKYDSPDSPGSVVNDVHYSPGAERFYSAGGELMQRGVENQRFAPMPRVDPKAKP